MSEIAGLIREADENVQAAIAGAVHLEAVEAPTDEEIDEMRAALAAAHRNLRIVLAALSPKKAENGAAHP